MSCEAAPYIWVDLSCVCQLDCLSGGSVGALFSLLDTPHPLWCPSSTQLFLPSALQDIYELKDQIQDVEGRYMQGLKELKVEGLELTACLLLFSGSSMASLTPYPASLLISLCIPSCSLHHQSLRALVCMILPSLPVLILLTSCGCVCVGGEDTPTIQPGSEL